MDFSLSLSSDWMNLLSIPFLLWTLKDVLANWKGMWDGALTPSDRQLILRFTIFLLLPGVVFLHELGHLFAALALHIPVVSFHYGPVMGYVETRYCDDAAKRLAVAFAGNFVQIIIGFCGLIFACLSKSPPMVAVGVYFGIYTIASTVVFYAMLSLGGFYGDWIQMYENPYLPGVIAIGIFHISLLLFLAWAMFATYPKLWFTRRTNPAWALEHDRLEKAYKELPTREVSVALAKSFMQAGLMAQALKVISNAEKAAPGNLELKFLESQILLGKGKTSKALEVLDWLASNEQLPVQRRAKIAYEIGQIQMAERNSAPALQAFSRAVELDPLNGDARTLKSVLLKASGQNSLAQAELKELTHPDMIWYDPANVQLAEEELKKLDDKN